MRSWTAYACVVQKGCWPSSSTNEPHNLVHLGRILTIRHAQRHSMVYRQSTGDLHNNTVHACCTCIPSCQIAVHKALATFQKRDYVWWDFPGPICQQVHAKPFPVAGCMTSEIVIMRIIAGLLIPSPYCSKLLPCRRQAGFQVGRLQHCMDQNHCVACTGCP